MNNNARENYFRQPYQFGSNTHSAVSGNGSYGRIKISGKLLHIKEKLLSYFKEMGVNNDCKYNDNSNGEGTYILTLSPPNKAKEIRKALNEKLKQDKIENISIDLYEPKDERNVYVKNLPLHITDKALVDLFQPYGSIISKKIIKKANNNNCIGFVRYTTKEEALRAIIEINNQQLKLLGNDRAVQCEFSKTSASASSFDIQRSSHNYLQNPVPRFQCFHQPDVTNVFPQYGQPNSYFNPLIEYQMASQFSNMSLQPNNLYYSAYEPNNVPILIPLIGNHHGNFPYVTYPGNYQNFTQMGYDMTR